MVTAVRAIRSDCTVPVFLFYFFFEGLLLSSHRLRRYSNPFFIRQIHLSGSLFRQCRQAVPPLKTDLTVHRLFCLCLSPFPFPRRIYSVSVRRMRQRLRCIPRHPFNRPFSRMTVNHRIAFPEQRSIHPRTAAHAYIVPSGYPFHSQYHVMTEGGVQCPAYEFIQNCFNVQPSGTV